MAHPWIYEFSGDASLTTPFGWDSETDVEASLDLAHYTELARYPWSQCAPWRGAYCLRLIMEGDTADHILVEGDLDIADGSTAFASFYLYLAPDVQATADDSWNIFEFQQAAGTVEASVGLRITAATDAVEIGIGDGTAASDYAAAPLEKNRWYHIEVGMLCSTSSVGTLTLYVDGANVVALTSLDQAAAIGRGVLGLQDTLSTTTGTILIDHFKFDDLQVYPDRERFPRQMTLTQSGHVFVGPGTVSGAALLSTTSGNILRLYDTDTGNVNDAQGFVAECDLAAFPAIQGPLRFQRGCFAQLSGTNPRAQVTLPSGNEDGLPGPLYYSAAGMRLYAQKRKERPGNV